MEHLRGNRVIGPGPSCRNPVACILGKCDRSFNQGQAQSPVPWYGKQGEIDLST